MLDIGWSELLVVAVVAVVVVGPKDLPKLMRTAGFYAGKLRRAASGFQQQFDEAMVESEAEEVRKNIEAIRGTMGEQPLMMPQTAPAQQAEAPKPEKRRAAPRAKTLGVKRPAPKPKVARTKTAPAKTSRAKPASPNRASTKRRKVKARPKP